MASSSSSPIFHPPLTPREPHLFPLLKRIHALPNLPPLLQGLTFPERLTDPHDLSLPSQLATLQAAIRALEEHQGLSPLLGAARELYQAYLERLSISQGEAQRKLLNGPARLFAILQKEEVALFITRERGEELLPLGLYASSFGTEAIFLSEGAPCQRERLEKIFPHSLFAKPELAPLLADPGIFIEECSPLAALYCWIVPRLASLPKEPRTEAIQTLFSSLRHLTASDEELLQALSDRSTPPPICFAVRERRKREQARLTTLPGYQTIVNILMKLGNDPHAATSQGETLLHLAAAQGDRALVAFFCRHSSSKEELDRGDIDGNTPLHLAARQGHARVVGLLLEAGAQVDRLNHQHESPLDLALHWGRDEVVSLFLKRKFFPTPLEGGDPEGVAYRAFEEAYYAHDRAEQLFWLEKLAQIQIRKRNYTIAAHLLNAAWTLTEDPICKNLIINQLERLEGALLFELFGKKSPPDHQNYLINYRQLLSKIRTRAAHYLENNRSAEDIQELLTESYRALLATLINESIALTGEQPPQFAVMGLGSMARLEMSPYSDLEFVFLVATPSPANLHYLRRLYQLISLKLINMGESERELLRPRRVAGESLPGKSLVSSGFSIDVGGLCPSGNGVIELIGSPRQLAQLQTERWLNQHSGEVILVNAMATVCYITGSGELVAAYQQAARQILDSSPAASSSSGPVERLRERRALDLIRGHVNEFQPRLNQEKIDLRGFDVKKELYRLLQTVVGGLALYYGLKSQNSFQQIDELSAHGVLSPEGASQLKEALRLTLRIRIKTHLFYQTECEILYHAQGERDETAKGLLTISPELNREITLIYRTLIPFHQAANQFLEGNTAAFSHSSLYDPRIGSYDDKLRERFQFDAALASAEEQVALNPAAAHAHLSLGNVFHDLGEDEKAIKSFETALTLFKEEHGEETHPWVGAALNSLGNSQVELGHFQLASECYERALAMFKQIPNSESTIATVTSNLGFTYHRLGDHLKALDHLHLALSMKQEIYKDQLHLDIASSLNLLAPVYLSLNQRDRAFEYLQNALTMQRELLGDQPHPETALILSNLAKFYYGLPDYREAIKHSLPALTMWKQVYRDRPHPRVAETLHLLGIFYKKIAKLEEIEAEEGELPREDSIEYFTKSLEMYEQIYSNQPHLIIARVSTDLGNAFLHFYRDYYHDNYEKAFRIYKQIYKSQPNNRVEALKGLISIYKKQEDDEKAIKYSKILVSTLNEIHHNQPHLDTSSALCELGELYLEKNAYQKAIQHYKAALAIERAVYQGQPHAQIAAILKWLGDACVGLKKYQKAINYQEEALDNIVKFYNNKPHQQVGIHLGIMGSIYLEAKKFKKAIEWYQRSYEMLLQTVGKKDPQTKIAKHNLDHATQKLKAKN